ncbi:hypothetical protein LACDD01_00843 [Lactococcus sp. DD01]|nr:hypothetical protein LACDD01_00843 [Lactococcus sp. DD01]
MNNQKHNLQSRVACPSLSLSKHSILCAVQAIASAEDALLNLRAITSSLISFFQIIIPPILDQS